MRQRTTQRPPQGSPRPSRARTRRAVIAGAGQLCLILAACACGASSPGASQAAVAGGAPDTGTGAVTRQGSGAGSGSGTRETTGGYTVAFAECMRAHGVPKFPNPVANVSPLSLDGVVNRASQAYQSALNGPCRSLAPLGWVSSGQVTR
jgi:hypothetical protein